MERPGDLARAPSPRRVRLAAALCLVALVALFVPTLLRLTSEARYPATPPRPPALGALSPRVVLVIVDSLRHDFATDPERAPHFARAMQEHASGIVWAGRITMTAAAVLSFGTGTRGTFSQVLLNIDAARASANGIFANARAAGLTTGIFGDPVWTQSYADFDLEHLSIQHLALDADDTPELLAEAERVVEGGTLPDLTVLHFFASDHMAHVHGVQSPAYATFLRRLDENLARFLTTLPRDTTVLALSDHGSLDNGNHGVDSELERKSPFFAYGPGIRAGARLELDQVDVAPTIAALLGIASPAHGVGVPATELLAIDADQSARLLCREAERVQALRGDDVGDGGVALPGCDAAAPPSARVAAARDFVRAWDGHEQERAARAGVFGFAWSLGVLGLLGLLLPCALGRLRPGRVLGAGVALAGLAATTVGLTALVDHLWDLTRALVTWVATALCACLLFAPRSAERVLGRLWLPALAVAPGMLFASFPIETQFQGGLVAIACLAAALVAAARSGVAWHDLPGPFALGALGTLVVHRLATVREDPFAALAAERVLGAGAALGIVWLGAAALFAPRRAAVLGRALELALGLALVLSALVPKPWLPAPLALGALAGLPVAALVLFRRGLPILGRASLFAAYGLVSRPIELPALGGVLLFAEVVGHALGRAERAATRARGHRPVLGERWLALVAATAAFALAYAARIGLQRGLDFENMDWNAGSFDSGIVSHARIGACLVAKYALGAALVGHAVVARLSPGPRRTALGLLAVGLVLRFGTMCAMLAAPGASFWARFRMVGELAPDAIMALVATLVSFAAAARREPASLTDPALADAREPP
ncbi:MAG: alkaline phosphatase family protein [Polyangiaceae bacterium]|nr:alkaline phosphatase family protein [Polyangiaceae bacterium]